MEQKTPAPATSVSPQPATGTPGRALGTSPARGHPARPGHLRLQAAGGIFRAVDLTPAGFPLLPAWGSGRGEPGELRLWVSSCVLSGSRSFPSRLIAGRYFPAARQSVLTGFPPGDSYRAAEIFVYDQRAEECLY